MRRIKTYLRCTMGQARLNQRMTLSVHKSMLDFLDLQLLAKDFVSGNVNRLCFIGNFA